MEKCTGDCAGQCSPKSLKMFLLGVIVILAIAVIYLAATRGGDEQSQYRGRPLGVCSPTGALSFNDQTAGANGNNNSTSTETTVPSSAKNMMVAQVPADLTAQQKSELAAGAADHQSAEMTFHITGGSFYFTPNEIRVKQGDKVKIIFTNVGGLHNLTFSNPQIATKTIKTGESDTIEFTAVQKGTFEFYCSVGNGYHRQKGQIGVLLVN